MNHTWAKKQKKGAAQAAIDLTRGKRVPLYYKIIFRTQRSSVRFILSIRIVFATK